MSHETLDEPGPVMRLRTNSFLLVHSSCPLSIFVKYDKPINGLYPA